MSEAMTMLETIKEGYFTFKDTMVEQSRKFPATIELQVDMYEASLCRFLELEKKLTKQSPPDVQEFEQVHCCIS